MKLHKTEKDEPVRLGKKTEKPKRKKTLPRIDLRTLNIILLIILLILICLIIVLIIYEGGALESTTFYYKMNTTIVMILPLLM